MEADQGGVAEALSDALKNGIPSEDTFLRVFRLMDPRQFEIVFRAWTAGILPALNHMESETEVVGTIAIDGKTIRGSGRGGCQAIHMVSAFATQYGLVLGQEKVDEKSNEITAIPLLLESLYLKGLLASIDAMGCQRDIAQHILKKEGDYLLAVKGNQPRLEQAVEAAVIGQGARAVVHQTVMTAHGRDVIQQARVIPATGWIDASLWPGCKMIGMIDSMRKEGDKPAEWERRYYISSRELKAEELAQAVRSHWGIENRLHWMLDEGFGEDACMVHKDHAPQNLSLLGAAPCCARSC